jgi:nucleoid-associated protein YgaU
MIPSRRILIFVVAVISALAAIGVSAWRLIDMQSSAPVAQAPVPPIANQALEPGRAPASTPPSNQPASVKADPPASQAAAPQSQKADPKPAPDLAPELAPLPLPSFDVVRVEPGGEAVVAGRAAPKSQVTLLSGVRLLGQIGADADGNFVILPQALSPGEHVLSLRSRLGEQEVASQQTVTMVVPQRGTGGVIAAVDAPNQPTRVLSADNSAKPQPAASPADGAKGLRIASVEAMAGGGAFMSGQAPAGAPVRLYLNDSFVASVTAGPDGKWTVRIDQGMQPGAYNVRADVIGADGKPLGRVEAPFDLPVSMAAAPVAAAPAPAPAAAQPPVVTQQKDESVAGAAVVAELRTARVERGDSLWRISRTIYGEGPRYTQIYDANTNQIRNPNLIFPGQVLVVPKQD